MKLKEDIRKRLLFNMRFSAEKLNIEYNDNIKIDFSKISSKNINELHTQNSLLYYENIRRRQILNSPNQKV